MLKSIFNGVYLLLFLRFLRGFYRKIVPSKEDLTLPRYLILAMFEDRTILLGYSDSIEVCHAYASETRWAITISEFTGSGYHDVARDLQSEEPSDHDGEHCLVSMWECGDIFSDEQDWRIMGKYGFDRTKIDMLVRRFKNGNYV